MSGLLSNCLKVLKVEVLKFCGRLLEKQSFTPFVAVTSLHQWDTMVKPNNIYTRQKWVSGSCLAYSYPIEEPWQESQGKESEKKPRE